MSYLRATAIGCRKMWMRPSICRKIQQRSAFPVFLAVAVSGGNEVKTNGTLGKGGVYWVVVTGCRVATASAGHCANFAVNN